MTQRAKPAAPRPRRSSSDRSSRRTLYLNIAFLAIILVGTATLIGAAIASYAGAHWAEVANVNGVSINQDQATAAADVDLFKLTYQVSQLRDDLAAGRLSQADFDSQNSNLTTAEQNVSSGVVDALVDDELQAQLAKQNGVTVTDQQVDAQVVADATEQEARHVLMIAVTPVAAGTTPTDAEKTIARETAEAAYGQLRAGTAFATVAKQFSTDATGPDGGDIGWIRQVTATQDANLVSAVFALPAGGGLTSVITGTDGSYLIGQVVATSPTTVDPNYAQRIKDAGVSMDAYRAETKSSLIDQALSAKITKDATTVASVQREVSEIKIDTTTYTGPGDQVRARHILYTPGNSDPNSTSSPIPSDDPGWAVAQSEAQLTYTKLKAVEGTPTEATEFATIAESDSKDTGSATDGGLLPYYDQGSGLDPAFAAAIFAPNLKAGDLLAPVRSQFGYHVILIDSIRPAPADRATAIQKQAATAGADFAALATANSDATDAAQGGDMGWIARDQLTAEQENAIFTAPVGSVSAVITLSDGLYIYKVSQEATRLPDASQITTLQSSAFTNWYAIQKAKATITGPDITPSSVAP
jgi:parvulin-like peptidyl-prolyl isomerase